MGVMTRAYRDGKLFDQGYDLVKVTEYTASTDVVQWVDVDVADGGGHLREVASCLNLHELAVEDALESHTRPKLDHYGDHLFLMCVALGLDADKGELQITEVDAFVARPYLVTVRKGTGLDIDDVTGRWDRIHDLVGHGSGYLLYGLIDTIIDGYFDVINDFDDFYDKVSDAIFGERAIELSGQRHWFEMRRSLAQFHRLAVQMEAAISSLMRRDRNAVEETLIPYYQDVYDHAVHVAESTDALRDLVSTIVDTNLTLRDLRLNQIMKKVTSWAAIIAVPTLVTGFYGMNVPFPGFGRSWGVVMAVFLLVVCSGALYGAFKRRDWL